MQQTLVPLAFAVALIAGVVAIFTLVTSGRTYDELGAGGLDSSDRDARPGAGEPAAADEREQEIRQMLDARSARRERRGEPAADLDAELAALLRPADEGLRDDVRALVDARNRRRVRAGLEPLDVEDEIERQLRELN